LNQKQQQKLDYINNNPNLSDVTRNTIVQHYLGVGLCATCRAVAEKKVIFKHDGYEIVERYCSEHCQY